MVALGTRGAGAYLCCTQCKCIGERRKFRVRATRDGQRQLADDDDQRLTDRYEERGALYYPDIDAEPRLDGEWETYYHDVERHDREGKPQTFAVEETPFSQIGYNMVSEYEMTDSAYSIIN